MPDKKISQMDPDTSLDGSEVVPVVQNGNKRTTTGAIAGLAPGTSLGYDPATRELSSSTGANVTIPLVNTTAAGLVPHTWLTGAEAATLPDVHGNLTGVVYEHVRNESGAPMPALTPYHVIDSHGDTSTVLIGPADPEVPASMPASGILAEELAPNAEGRGALAGVLTGVDTSAWASGMLLYVAVGGGLTATMPTAGVQAVAVVGRSHATTGTLGLLPGPALSRVAFSGDYGDLGGLPALFAPASPGTTSTYTASGAISLSDQTAIINSASPVTMTLAAGSSNGQTLVIKRIGAGSVTVTASLDGVNSSIIADSTVIQESVMLAWSPALSTWLIL